MMVYGYYLTTDFGYTRAGSILLLFNDNVQVSVHWVCVIKSSSYVYVCTVVPPIIHVHSLARVDHRSKMLVIYQIQ